MCTKLQNNYLQLKLILYHKLVFIIDFTQYENLILVLINAIFEENGISKLRAL